MAVPVPIRTETFSRAEPPTRHFGSPSRADPRGARHGGWGTLPLGLRETGPTKSGPRGRAEPRKCPLMPRVALVSLTERCVV